MTQVYVPPKEEDSFDKNRSGWLEWLKRPENLMTGIVLAAGLAQKGNRDQSTAGVIGERFLGAMAFRGGLQAGQTAKSEREREHQFRVDSRAQEMQDRSEGRKIQREGIQANKEEGAATRTHQQTLHNTPRPMTGAEENLVNAQAGYYNRMPRDGSGGSNKEDMYDPYEETMFKEWMTSKQNESMTTGKPYVLDPMEWNAHVQPYRNAQMMLKAMAAQGVLGEVRKDAKGNWTVGVRGVRDPIAEPVAGNPSVAVLDPQPPVAAPTQPGIVDKIAGAIFATPEEKATRRKAVEEFFGNINLKTASDGKLKKMLKEASKEQAIVIREELRSRGKGGGGR